MFNRDKVEPKQEALIKGIPLSIDIGGSEQNRTYRNHNMQHHNVVTSTSVVDHVRATQAINNNNNSVLCLG